jgi:hypothetical protein
MNGTLTLTKLSDPIHVPGGDRITWEWSLAIDGDTYGSGAPTKPKARAAALACAASHGYTPEQIEESR